MFRSGGGGGGRNEEDDDVLMQQAQQQEGDGNMSDDDNAAPEMQSEAEADSEDPLLLAMDDLEGRVVAALDDVKMHPGVKSAPNSNVHEELATLLRPVLEVAAHTAPSVARTYYQGVGPEGIEASCEDVYQRVVSDLVLPVLLEMAQSDTNPAKRGASLEFFRNLYKEWHKAGSWLDATTQGALEGPYGSGSHSHRSSAASNLAQTPAARAQQKRRQTKKLARESELLRYWVQASIACTLPGAFTSDASEGAVAARGVIAASASLRPSLKLISQRIRDADDRGANKLFVPVMTMVQGVLKKLFVNSNSATESDAVRSSCIKFLEIVCLCCSAKPQDSSQRRRGTASEDFSLEDLPAGHPVITRESLESVGEYAFATLRGLLLLGGQVKIDVNLLSDMMLGGDDNSPAAQVVSILKPAALAYLEIESSLPASDSDDALNLNLDRTSMEFDFILNQKSYALTVNAVSALAMNRPVYFKDGAVCLARRTADPPQYSEDGHMTKSGVLAIQAAVKASCLTLLRNALSVATNSFNILHKTLLKCDMEIQADKALRMARQATELKTAGRAKRNRANMFYEWEASDQISSKRQKETDEALAKIRAAKAAKGLGQGIQLPTSMSDSIDLVMANLTHLPSKRPTGSSKRKSSVPVTLDFMVDAVMTNGASLAMEEGRWYSRDGGSAWDIHVDGAEVVFDLDPKLMEEKKSKSKKQDDKKAVFTSQCHTAAGEALGRIVANGAGSRYAQLSQFSNQIAAKLAWTISDIPPPTTLAPAHEMALESIENIKRRIADGKLVDTLDSFGKAYPLAASCLALEGTSVLPNTEDSANGSSFSKSVLMEAYMRDCLEESDGESSDLYERSLDLYVGSIVQSSERAMEKPNDADKKTIATHMASSLQKDLLSLPHLTPEALALVSAVCDIDEITKKAAESAKKQSQQSIAVSAALHAAKQAAEKRATGALVALRDIAFQHTKEDTRFAAVASAVALAAGRYPSTASCEDKALKLVMNVLFAKSENLAEDVVKAAIQELERASDYAIENYDKIEAANKEALEKAEKESSPDHPKPKTPFAPNSDEEKVAMDKVRKVTVVFMAICVRKPDIIKTLFELSSREKADVLSKTVRQNMSKVARAAGVMHGTEKIALQVAEFSNESELPLLLAFLDNLAPLGDKNLPSDEFIEICHKIQESKAGPDGKKDVRFLIPVVTGMKRGDLANELPKFVQAEEKIFLAALERMSARTGRHALLFREEPDPEAPALKGMTLCEQLVYLHTMDFAAAGIPLKEYLGAIRICIENDELFNDRLVMAALDHMSGKFLTGEEKLPLAYMRTIILVCSKHESLHNWICHVLLPRLIEGKIYEDKKQWEGWMRCAKMLEKSGEGVSSLEAISKLPPEQLANYQARYGTE